MFLRSGAAFILLLSLLVLGACSTLREEEGEPRVEAASLDTPTPPAPVPAEPEAAPTTPESLIAPDEPEPVNTAAAAPVVAEVAQVAKPQPRIVRPAEAPSTVVFVRASLAASAVEAALYEIRRERPHFLTLLKNNSRVEIPVARGDYLFMLVAGDSVDFLELHAQSGKTYYSVVKPSLGAWKPSFAFQGVKQRGDAAVANALYFDDSGFQQMLAALVERQRVAAASAEPAGAEVVDKYRRHWAQWQREDVSKKSHKVLSVIDGH